MSSKQTKSAYGEGLSMSQVWCDVLNFLAGLCCIINGLRTSGWKNYDSELFYFTGFAYCAVTVVSLIGFCLGKKFGEEKTQFWSRVWMFPVITPLFIMAIIFSLDRYSYIYFPVQLTVSLLGYLWYLTSLIILISRKFGCYCEKKKTVNIQSRPDCVENIYENDKHIQDDLI